MRRFLYITPYFPPQSRVGALRPLKFARHLRQHGWSPVVLCDLWDGAEINPILSESIPPETTVLSNYSARASSAKGKDTTLKTSEKKQPQPSGFSWQSLLPEALNNPELIPLGEHSVHIPHALKAARRALKEHPDCEAIMVNSDPYAAMIVGAILARETGLPLIQDLRDPWSVCELRRPRRPAPISAIVDWLEKFCVQSATRVILNTETTLHDYREHYRDLPSSHFDCIRNHHDAALIQGGSHPGFDRYTLLFLGGFRRFTDGKALLEVLAALRDLGANDIQMAVTGKIPAETWARADELGVRDMLTKEPFVPYTEISPIMNAADVLLAFVPDTRQRFPAKVFDYATTSKPILTVSDNPELEQLLEGLGQSAMFRSNQPIDTARWILAQRKQGPGGEERNNTSLSSQTASAALAKILNEISGARPSDPSS